VLPVLFRLGDLAVPSYGVLSAAAFLAAVALASYLGPRVGIPRGRVVDVSFLMAIVGEVAARLAFVLVEWGRIAGGALDLKRALLGGRVQMVGVFAGFAFTCLYVRRYRISPRNMADVAFTATALGIGIGRLGCLMAGCCYGKPTDWPWAITFDAPLAHRLNGTPLGIGLHPTQIVQSILAFGLCAVLLLLFRRRRYEGQVAGWFFVLAGLTRLGTEILRGDPRGSALGLSTSQWIAAGFVAFGLAWFRWSVRSAPVRKAAVAR